MTTFYLSGYVSPAEQSPTFVIPTFTKVGSNDAFVQNLSSGGQVLEFMLLREGLFYPVPVLAPCISLEESGTGLLAFWSDSGQVLVAPYGTMQDVVADVGAVDPFVDLELAAVLQDDQRAARAAEAVAVELGDTDIAKRWLAREVTTFRRARPDRSTHAPDGPAAAGPQDTSFQKLINNPKSGDWAERWMKLWRSGYKRMDLEQVALWWLDLRVGHADPQGYLLDCLVRESGDPRKFTYARRWLEEQDLMVRFWTQVWSGVNSRIAADGRTSHRLLALEKLQNRKSHRLSITRNWSLIWTWLWRSDEHRETLARLAEQALSDEGSASRSFAEFVLQPLACSDNPSPPIVAASINWLERNPRSDRLWADLFLTVFDITQDERLAQAGRRWVRVHGGNINRWRDVWKQLVGATPHDERFDAALAWLRRARWDLTTWPKVFDEAAAMRVSPEKTRDLFELGQRWTSGDARPRIRQSLAYLDTKLKERATDS